MRRQDHTLKDRWTPQGTTYHMGVYQALNIVDDSSSDTYFYHTWQVLHPVRNENNHLRVFSSLQVFSSFSLYLTWNPFSLPQSVQMLESYKKYKRELTLSIIWQNLQQRSLKISRQKCAKILYKWQDIYWTILEIIISTFFFCDNVFQRCQMHRHQTCLNVGKGWE